MLSSPRLHQVIEQTETGYFSAALQTLQRHYNSKNPLDRVLRAELLVRTGEHTEASGILRSIVTLKKVDDCILARAYEILGLLNKHEDNLREALDHWQQSLELARGINDLDQQCRAQLHMLTTRAELLGDLEFNSLLSITANNIRLHGKGYFLASLHRQQAELDAKRGALSGARKHLRDGFFVIDEWPNLYVEANLNLCSSVVHFLSNENSVAIEHATRANQLARASGYRFLEAAAISNLGQLHLHDGNLSAARRHLEEASALMTGRRSLICLYDNLAQLAIVERDIRLCENYVKKISYQLKGIPLEEQSFTALATHITRIEFLRLSNSHDQALLTANALIETTHRRRNRHLEASFHVAKAELLLEMNHLSDAAFAIDVAETLASDSPFGLVGHIERVKGKLARTLGQVRIAKSHLQRSSELFKSLGHHIALRDAHRELDSLRLSEKALAKDTDVEQTELSVVVAGLSSLRNLRERPDVLGREFLHLWRRLKCAGRIALVSLRDGGQSSIVDAHGWPQVDIDKIALPSPATLRLSLGSIGAARYEILIETARLSSNQILAREAIAFLRKVISDASADSYSPACSISDLPSSNSKHNGLSPPSSSAVMSGLLNEARRIAISQASVLVTGESGTGKEVIARFIHSASRRSDKPFVPVICTGSSDALISHLCGHRRGAFTGALESRLGVFRAAEGGTVLLDEVADLPWDIQTVLLRIVDAKEVHAMGEHRPEKVDIRFIAATNRNLERLVADGVFREDLLHRLSCFRLEVPPLRARREDILPMFEFYLSKAAEELGYRPPRISEEAAQILLSYSWPGNIRELVNEASRLPVLLEKGRVVLTRHLSAKLRQADKALKLHGRFALIDIGKPLPAIHEDITATLVSSALEASSGNISAAARLLGVSRKGLSNMLKRVANKTSDSL